jgi:hypothetical protein
VKQKRAVQDGGGQQLVARRTPRDSDNHDNWSPAVHTINVEALTTESALLYARRVDLDTKNGFDLNDAIQRRAVPVELVDHVRYIAAAIASGWFEVPRGLDLTFSKAQHAKMRHLAAQAPWLDEIHSEALAFEEFRLGFTPRRGISFGVKSIPNLASEAFAIRNRLSRLPLEHETGEITVWLWVQVLSDTQERAKQVRAQIECLSSEWMWDQAHSLAEQVAHLRRFGCIHLLAEYVSTTRNRNIDRFEMRLLDEVRYRNLPVAEYESRLMTERQRQIDEARAGWGLNFKLIRHLASILDGASSFHQGTLSRRLKQESNGLFRLQRSALYADALSIEIRYQYEVGNSFKFASPFLLVNYCLALADEIETAEPVFEDYLRACERAYARIKDMEEPTPDVSPQHRKRRPDDFEGAAA